MLFRLHGRRFALPLVLMAASLLNGCGGSSEQSNTNSPIATQGRIEPFDFTFSTSKRTFKLGEGVPLTLSITNAGPERIIANGGGAGGGAGNRMHALIEKDGVSIWRKVGTGFGDYSENNWRADETRSYSYTWVPNNEGRYNEGSLVTPGTYTITPYVPSGVNVGVKNPEMQSVAPPLEITIRE